MGRVETSDGGHLGARDVSVWDPLVRLIHWGLALAVLLNGAITDEDGAVHEWVGYAALGLLAIRLVWGIVGPGPARFAAFPPSPAAALGHIGGLLRGDRTVHLSHNPLGALMVYNIWLTVAALCATGIMMGSVRYFGIGWVEEAHEMAFSWLMFSVVLHVGGVLFDSWRSGVPLAKAMVTGRKSIPYDRLNDGLNDGPVE